MDIVKFNVDMQEQENDFFNNIFRALHTLFSQR